jgi:uncharacterized protein YqgV (UPF0045/DUF77 family)
MHAIAHIRVDPIGNEGSQREVIQRAVDTLRQGGLQTRVGDLGTEVEGELETIFTAVREVHDQLHASGMPRLSTQVTVETRGNEAPALGAAKNEIE